MYTFGKLTTVLDNIMKMDDGDIGVQVFRNKQVQKFIVKLNAFDQLFRDGVDANGEIIGVYSAFTEEMTQGATATFGGVTKGKIEGDPYNWYFTGDFLKSFKVTQIPDGFNIFADDVKPDGTVLTQKYGDDLLGLNEKSNIELVKAVTPKIIEIIRGKILA